jgi:MGT family glycosyltransferase
MLRRRFLLAMWEGGGNVPPELGVARRLVARGHSVHVLGDPTIERGAEAAGCTFSPWTRAPHHTSLDPMEDPIRDWESTNPLVLLQRLRDRFIAGPAARFAADTSDAIASVRPDALLADAFLFGSVIAAQAASLPVVLLVSNIWVMPARGTPPIGPGFAPARSALGRGRDAAMVAVVNRLFRKGLPAVNRARAEYGLAPLSSFYDQALAADRILVLTSPEFDYAAATVPANVAYVGPILDDPEWAGSWTPPWSADDGRPLVLVGFSTTYQNQGPVLRRVVEALSSLPVRAVVTLGQMLDATEVHPSENVAVVASVPHQSVLPHASLVVSHCGHGTTMKALAAGVPLVCIPMGRDQFDTAARVVEAGAGVRLRTNASATRMRKAVMQVLGDDRYRANAAHLATAIREGRRTTDLVSEIETVTGPVPVV